MEKAISTVDLCLESDGSVVSPLSTRPSVFTLKCMQFTGQWRG